MSHSVNIAEIQAHLYKHLKTRGFGEGFTLTLMAHGEANLIFRVNSNRLIRVAVNTPNKRFEGDFKRVTQFEEKILTYLSGSGIGHELQARQLQPSDDFNYTYLITNYLEGGPLDYGRSHLQHCATTLAHLHRLPQNPGYALDELRHHVPTIAHPLTLFFEESRDYAQPYLQSADADADIVKMLEAVLAKAEQRLSAESLLSDYPHQCLVHSDHTYENWVVNSQQAYLVDWEWAEIGSPAGDLGHFLSPVTVRRRHNYRLPAEDREFFLHCYYEALEDADLAERIRQHFVAFGPYPAVRSLCWTAGYWVTANRWYADTDSPNAGDRMARLKRSQQQFPELWQEVMDWLNYPVESG
ncbi:MULTISPECIES: phosphotransferase [unclassified Leptolyngbya]|uniref:phosphotransferase n=1 Tax=unclassified Leptolyngbya TaxID=2650499 RepID=UPI00168790F3|nr:phosphotransferase [Leptolyngbya sp. FACHB-8]MBD2155510.1 phosphotransferase [Leptolyngbya sp. FACHB-16]